MLIIDVAVWAAARFDLALGGGKFGWAGLFAQNFFSGFFDLDSSTPIVFLNANIYSGLKIFWRGYL